MLTIRVANMVIKSKLSGDVFVVAISSGGKKPCTIIADFNQNKLAGLVEGHCSGMSSRRKKWIVR